MSKPPPGFEHLSDPQEVIATLYYEGDRLGETVITFTPDWVEIHNPEAVANLIENIDTAKKKQAVIAALSAQLPVNSQYVCRNKKIPVCKAPDIPVAGIVFDENFFRLDIFINPAYIKANTQKDLLLPPSTAGLSLVNEINGQLSGSSSDSQLADNMTNRGKLAYHSGRINYDTSYTTIDQGHSTKFQINQLNTEWERQRLSIKTGLTDTIGGTFITDQTILGVRAGSTLDTVYQSIDEAAGSPIVLFLPLPSQVRSFRNGKLISSGFYPAGEQAISTKSFPDGAYDVTFEIQDSFGNTHKETRYFAKTRQIPPIGYPVYYVATGLLENTLGTQNPFPHTQNIPIYQVGMQKRIKKNVGLGLSLIGSEDRSFLSTDLFLLFYRFTIQPAILLGTDADYGTALKIDYASLLFNASVQGKKIWGTPSNSSTQNGSSFDPITSNTSELNGNLSFPTSLKTTVNLGARISKTENEAIDRAYSVSTSTNVYSNRDTNLRLELSASYSVSQETLFLATLQLYFSSGNFTNSASTGFRKDNNFNGADNTGSTASVRSEWRNLDAAAFGTSLAAGVNTDAGRETYDASLENSNRRSTINLSTRYNQGAGQDATSQYNASINSRMVWAANTFTLGGGRFENNGVIVRVNEKNDPTQKTPGTFEVYNGSQVAKVINTNSDEAIFLQSYRTYNIHIKSASNNIYRYSEKPQTVTLYPGNFQVLEWEAQQINIIFTRIITAPNKPLTYARVKENTNRNYNFTDDYGFIQLEVPKDQHKVIFEKNNQSCTVILPDNIQFKENLATLDDLLCVPNGPVKENPSQKPTVAPSATLSTQEKK